MPLPKPNAGETQSEFVSRCIKFVHDEGSDMDDDQIQAACYQKWRDEKGESSHKNENVERRYFPVKISELRVVSRGQKPPSIEGYAAVFNKLSENLGGFREKIAPGAFKRAIKSSDTRMLYNHDQNYVLGRKGAGTLTLNEDEKGLRVRAIPPTWASWIIESIDRGDVSNMSFGFMTEKDEWDHKNNVRTLLEVSELVDVSPVTFPAYPDTTVALRSLEKSKEQEKQSTDETEPKLVESDDDKDSAPKRSVDRLEERLKLRLKRSEKNENSE